MLIINIIPYLTMIPGNLKFLTEKVKNFVVLNSGNYFKSSREKFYSKLSEEENLTKVAESFYSPGSVGILWAFCVYFENHAIMASFNFISLNFSFASKLLITK